MPAVIQDNRIFDRFSSRFPLKFKETANEFGTEVFLKDVSAQGAKISTQHRVFINDSISLQVKLPDSDNPLDLNGRVMWIKTKSPHLWDVGLKFHKISFMLIQRLYKYAVNL